VLAYLFWHRRAAAIERDAYERELERFHRSLARRPPSGFRSSAAFRVGELPWLSPEAPAAPPSPESDAGEPRLTGPGAGYEDWYLVDDWAALGVLEEAAVSRGHISAHEAVASHARDGAGAVYRLIEGSARIELAERAVWVSAAPRRERLSFGALLGDGIDPREGGLWQRCLVLGPAPEYCLLADEQPAGVAASRLPAGWSALSTGRHPLWNG
jgi:hypothetical protein